MYWPCPNNDYDNDNDDDDDDDHNDDHDCDHDDDHNNVMDVLGRHQGSCPESFMPLSLFLVAC